MVDFQTLGFGLVSTYRKGDKGRYQLVVAKKGWESLKQKLKSITRKTTPYSFDERIRDWKRLSKVGSTTFIWQV